MNENNLLLFNKDIPELEINYARIIGKDGDIFKSKRLFEFSILKAVTSCNLPHLRLLTEKVLSDITPKSFKNHVLIYYTVGIITLLTRVAMIEGVSEKDAYALSDTYFSINFYNLNIDPLELIYEIIENFIKLIDNAKHHQGNSIVAQTAKYVHNHINSKITLNNIADYLQITPEHLSIYFKKHTGITVKNFINKEKINHSKFLLITTELTILEISFILEYPDQSYFSKLFKKFTGQTPLEYRKKGVYMLTSSSTDN